AVSVTTRSGSDGITDLTCYDDPVATALGSDSAMITTIFFDIGGVLLTDGWGHVSRRAAAEKFGLDWDEYSERHEKVAHAIEINRLTLERYLDRAGFYPPRAFTRAEFRAFIFAQSLPQLVTSRVTQA